MALKVNSEVLALSLLTVGEQAHAFSSFMPSRFTISNWVLEGTPKQVDERISALRSGYKPAIGFGLGLAAVVSAIAKSPLPLLMSGVATVAMVGLYEGALPPGKRLTLASLLGNVPAAPALDGRAALMGGL